MTVLPRTCKEEINLFVLGLKSMHSYAEHMKYVSVNDTSNNGCFLTMLYGTIKCLLYYFLIGTNVHSKVTAGGVSHF